MSRILHYKNNKIKVFTGEDVALGKFYQIFDNTISTPDGEGLVYDWSDRFKTETNYTGISSSRNPIEIIDEYILQSLEDDDE